jgi:alpha-galactosidase
MTNTDRTCAHHFQFCAAPAHHTKMIAILFLALFAIPSFCISQTPDQKPDIANGQVSIFLSCGQGCSWSYRAAGASILYRFAPPSFELDRKRITAEVSHFALAGEPLYLSNGVTEYSFDGVLAEDADLHLGIEFQVNDGTPLIRFRYTLKASRPRAMIASSGADQLTYLQTSLQQLPWAEEVQLSNFAELIHSYTLTENKIGDRYFEDGQSVMGPILAATDGHNSFLLAYEHGSMVPDAFLQYRLSPDRGVRLMAVKGNYYLGQIVDADHPYQTVWLETSAQEGGLDELASAYRKFVLKYMTQNTESRKPYIFYNTWNF